ncbi:MAG: heavy metal-associated domain-containing protein [Dehalococcoidia bacterium]|jgi:copper chaperone
MASQTIELNITGMTCDHCVRSVTNALKDVPGVEDVTVSLEKSEAIVRGDSVEVAALVAAVEEEEYGATPR